MNENDYHKKFAVELFNITWDLLENPDRTQAETDQMIHACHASRYHWGVVGKPLHLARGEWLLAYVYAHLKRPDACFYHARRCYHITLGNELQDFDLAFAYEAMARAHHLLGNLIETKNFLKKAKEAAEDIQKEDDRLYFLEVLQSIQ